MAKANFARQQNINISHIMIGLFFMIVAAGTFVVIVTNMLVTSQVKAVASEFAAAAYQNNPVNVTPAAQTNNAPAVATACIDPEATAVSGDGYVLGASTGGTGVGVPSSAAVLAKKATANKQLPFASYAYNQSNSSVITTTSTNTFIKDSYNTSNRSSSKTSTLVTNNGNDYSRKSTVVANNGNTDNRWSGNTANYTDNRWSGNSVSNSYTRTSTNTVIRDNGNTTNNNQAWNNGNTSNNNVGNTTNTDNSNNSTNNSGNDNSTDNSNNSTNNLIDIL